METIAIGEHVKGITEALGLDYKAVVRLDIEPGDVVAEVLRRNEGGHFFIDKETGEAVKDRFTFKITT